MKYALKILLLTGFCIPVAAQEIEDDTIARRNPEARARVEAARAAYITERLQLTTQEAEKFWPIYREFAEKRRGYLEQYRKAKRDGISEEKLIDLQLDLKQQELDLEKDYSKRFSKVIPAEKLVNLRSAERDFNRLVMRQLHHRQMQDKGPHFRERRMQRHRK